MDRRKRLLVCLAGLSICMGFLLTEEITVQAGEKEGHDFMCSGVGTVLDPNDFTVDEPGKSLISIRSLKPSRHVWKLSLPWRMSRMR